MSALGVSTLVLIGVLLLGVLVLGIMVWRRGVRVAELEFEACTLHNELRRLKRGEELNNEANRLSELTNDEMLAEFNRGSTRHDPGDG